MEGEGEEEAGVSGVEKNREKSKKNRKESQERRFEWIDIRVLDTLYRTPKKSFEIGQITITAGSHGETNKRQMGKFS